MQTNIFELTKPKYKITKPIRLIELFAGIGSQAKALHNIGANFEHYKIVEFDKYAIASYNAIHNTNFNTQDITKIKAKDLGIVNTKNYEYILTYSFPCQDLSIAGKLKGMKKEDNTRSGLLWEVERLLNECEELPQILLMENVPQVIGKKNIQDFHKWQLFLEKLGYSNYIELLNAKNYGIPQNRNRCFMVSILGDFYYGFPKKQKLKLKLKDMLEDEVDEKYYLSDKMIACLIDMTNRNGFVRGKKFRPHTLDSKYAYTITTRAGSRATDNFIINSKGEKFTYIESENQIGNLSGGKWDKINESCRRVYNVEKNCPTLHTMQGGNTEPKVLVKGNYSPSNHNASRIVDKNGLAPTVMENHGTVTAIVDVLRIRKLTPKECWRLMGFTDEDFEKAENVNSNSQLYKQAGNSIVVNVLEKIFKNLF